MNNKILSNINEVRVSGDKAYYYVSSSNLEAISYNIVKY